MSKRNAGKGAGADGDRGVWVDAIADAEGGVGPDQRYGAETKSMASVQSLIDDEVSSRLFAAAAAIVEDRRQLSVALHDYKQLTQDAQRSIELLKEERQYALQAIEKKEDEIAATRRLAADKQLKYDQLLEDYNQLRANDARQYEQLQQQLKEMRLTYENLNADYNRFRADSNREGQRLEAEVRAGVVKYQQLQEEHNRVREENANLKASIVNFTQQMSSFKIHDLPHPPQANPVPIQPIAADGDQVRR